MDQIDLCEAREWVRRVGVAQTPTSVSLVVMIENGEQYLSSQIITEFFTILIYFTAQ